MQAETAKAPRLLRYDAGLLFLWCWLLGFGFVFADGYLSIVMGLGAGILLFGMSAAFLFGKRHSPQRLRIAMIAAAIITALITWGSITHP